MQGTSADYSVGLECLLHKAAQCIRGGAQLRSLTCAQSVQHHVFGGLAMGAIARYSELGEQLSGLRDLRVHGTGSGVLGAVGVVACSVPSLTGLEFSCSDQGPKGWVLPPICSASLESITGRYNLSGRSVPPPPVVLTFLAGCTQLRHVRVQFFDTPKAGASVKIRCHCISQSCIMPFEGRAEVVDEFVDDLPWKRPAGREEVAVRFLPPPASPQGVQAFTVLFTWLAIGPEQAPKWGHVVMAGAL